MGEDVFAELQVRGPAFCRLLAGRGNPESDATIGTATRSTVPTRNG